MYFCDIYCSQYLNIYEIQQIVDFGFLVLDVNFKDNFFEYEEFVILFNQKDVDGNELIYLNI